MHWFPLFGPPDSVAKVLAIFACTVATAGCLTKRQLPQWRVRSLSVTGAIATPVALAAAIYDWQPTQHRDASAFSWILFALELAIAATLSAIVWSEKVTPVTGTDLITILLSMTMLYMTAGLAAGNLATHTDGLLMAIAAVAYMAFTIMSSILLYVCAAVLCVLLAWAAGRTFRQRRRRQPMAPASSRGFVQECGDE